MKRIFRLLIPILVVIMPGCGTVEKEAGPVRVVRIATVLGRVMSPLADALARVLPDRFPARVEVQKTDTTQEYVHFIDQGKVDLALIQADAAYVAYNHGIGNSPGPRRALRGVATLYTRPLQLLTKSASGIRNLSDLRGKLVFVGAAGSPIEFTAKMTLEGVGLKMTDIHQRYPISGTLAESLRAGEVEAVFAWGNAPMPSIQDMMQVPGVVLLSISPSEIEKIRSHHPFLQTTSIPAGAYGHHSEIDTVGVDMLLVCRDDMPEELVYWITRTLFESLPDLAMTAVALRQVDLERMQASPIPLHAGAARFYRERELFP